MLRYNFTTVKEFDELKERNRINNCFIEQPEIKEKLENVLNSFIAGDYELCAQLVQVLGYDDKNGYDIIEYVSCFVIDSLNFIAEGGSIKKDEFIRS